MRGTVCLLISFLAPTQLPAQSASGAFVVTLGKDTIAVERYTRTATRLESDIIARDRAPVILRHVVVDLRPDGSFARVEGTNTPASAPAGTPPVLKVVATATGDSTAAELTRNGATQLVKVATPGGAVPFINFSYSLYELTARRGKAAGGSPAKVLAWAVLSASTLNLVVTPMGADSVGIGFEGDAPTLMQLDREGRITSANGRLTTQKVIVTRLAAVDIAALTASFANRPLGQLSPPDSIRASVAGATIALDYGRPSMRGRKIFGGEVVPWGTVWRTGANFATRFTTSADLVIGGQTVPTGTYTLWTLPTPTGWKLIINKQTKAPCADAASCASPQRARLWGTDYNADSDFVRVDMRVEKLPAPVEEYVMGVEPQGAGGILKLEWETTRAWVAFTKK